MLYNLRDSFILITNITIVFSLGNNSFAADFIDKRQRYKPLPIELMYSVLQKKTFQLSFIPSGYQPLVTSIEIANVAGIASILREFRRLHHETLEYRLVHSSQGQTTVVFGNS